MTRVNIYDRKNPDRLLGSMARPFTVPGGRYYRVPLLRQLPIAFDPYSTPTMECHTVEFSFGWRETNGGWAQERVMLTDWPLEDVQHVRDFRFPRETANQAAVREYHR